MGQMFQYPSSHVKAMTTWYKHIVVTESTKCLLQLQPRSFHFISSKICSTEQYVALGLPFYSITNWSSWGIGYRI